MKTVEVVAGIIEDKASGKILATERGYGEFKGLWEFPGGKIEPGETREAALVRELREELAIDVKIEKFIATVEYDYPKFHLTMHTFLCTIAEGEITLREHKAARWLSRKELSSVEWLPADRDIATSLGGAF